MNTIFLFLYHGWGERFDVLIQDKNRELLLLINFCYIFALYLVPDRISDRVLFVEEMIKQSSLLVVLHLLLLTACFFLFSYHVNSYSFFVAFYIIFFLAFVLWRVIARLILKAYRRSGRNFQRVVIVGVGKNGLELYDEMKIQLYYGYRVLGVFDDNPEIKDLIPEYIGPVSEVEAFCLENNVDEIYCTLPGSRDDKIWGLFNFAEKNMIRFYLVPEFYRYLKKKFTLQSIDHLPIIALRDEPLQYWHHRFFKRCFDVVFASAILIFIFPFMYLILGVVIKLSSPGPVIFKQLRTGLYGREFYCYKFRSMRINNDSDNKQANKEDPRITSVGKFMRKTNLDEFPQFYNILKGDMSVVGPRPHMLKHTQEYADLIDKYMVRHLVKPGLTGWAQVTGCRGETRTLSQMEERVKKDVWYLENASILLDMKIIFLTVWKMFFGDKNAY